MAVQASMTEQYTLADVNSPTVRVLAKRLINWVGTIVTAKSTVVNDEMVVQYTIPQFQGEESGYTSWLATVQAEQASIEGHADYLEEGS